MLFPAFLGRPGARRAVLSVMNRFSTSSLFIQKSSFGTSVFANAKVRKTVRLLSLDNLQENPGALKKRKRVGRGPSSGLGKTCGKGHKGTYQRGKLKKRGFEGGHSQLWKRTPKRGRAINPKIVRRLVPLNLDKLMVFIREGRIDTSKLVDMKAIRDSGIVGFDRDIKHGIKLIVGSRGENAFLTDYPKLIKEGLAPPQLEVSDVDDRAKAALEQVGGSVALKYFARVPLRAHFLPEKFEILPRGDGIPPRKLRAKYGYVFPEDRIYTGTDKPKKFSPRVANLGGYDAQ